MSNRSPFASRACPPPPPDHDYYFGLGTPRHYPVPDVVEPFPPVLRCRCVARGPLLITNLGLLAGNLLLAFCLAWNAVGPRATPALLQLAPFPGDAGFATGGAP